MVIQHGFNYVCEYKYEQSFVKCEKSHYVWSIKHFATGHKKNTTAVLQAKDGLAFVWHMYLKKTKTTWFVLFNMCV